MLVATLVGGRPPQWWFRPATWKNSDSGLIISSAYITFGDTRKRSLSRHCATSRKVACLISDVAIGIFHWHNPSGCTTALGLNQPLTEMSTRNISWGYVGLQPHRLHVPIVLESGSLNLLESPGLVQACNGITFTLAFKHDGDYHVFKNSSIHVFEAA
jgi:hypothetical protein